MPLKIIILDVGNADSIVLFTPDKSVVVVDAPSPRKVVTCLEAEGVTTINSLYYTHDHQDHLPSLSGVANFIDSWRKKRRYIGYVFLPTRVLRKLYEKEEDILFAGRREGLLRHSLDKLDLWHRQRALRVIRAETGAEARVVDGVTIDVLHPDMLFYERFAATNPHKINETSLVLRIEYGEFRALLLADIERDGLVYLLEQTDDIALRCSLLKVPHHGAWYGDGRILIDLLERADPEIAVLSVGSRNPHGHVAPQLFTELWRIKCDAEKRLSDFVCTEITRTCVFSSSERASMDRQGLTDTRPCAGDIVIVANSSGTWERVNEIVHRQKVGLLPRAACCGRADLALPSTD